MAGSLPRMVRNRSVVGVCDMGMRWYEWASIAAIVVLLAFMVVVALRLEREVRAFDEEDREQP